MKCQQLSFSLAPEEEPIAVRLAILQKKLENIRSGLFKRYEEAKKTIEFLEGEIEDLVKDSICSDGSSNNFG